MAGDAISGEVVDVLNAGRSYRTRAVKIGGRRRLQSTCKLRPFVGVNMVHHSMTKDGLIEGEITASEDRAGELHHCLGEDTR